MTNPQSSYFETLRFKKLIDFVLKNGAKQGLSMKQTPRELILVKDEAGEMKGVRVVLGALGGGESPFLAAGRLCANANFLNAARFLTLNQRKTSNQRGKTKPKNLVILSGDRHMAEISKCSLPGLGYPLFDLTASGLTHTRTAISEANKFRSGNHMYVEKNFGLFKIEWTGDKPSVTSEFRGVGNGLLGEEKIGF